MRNFIMGLGLIIGISMVIYGLGKFGYALLEKEQNKQEYICLSFANYCLEVHEIAPTHETYLRFMEQEKLYPGYYRKHIIDAQKEYDKK